MKRWERRLFTKRWERAWFQYATRRFGRNGPYLTLEKRTFRAGWKAAKR